MCITQKFNNNLRRPRLVINPWSEKIHLFHSVIIIYPESKFRTCQLPPTGNWKLSLSRKSNQWEGIFIHGSISILWTSKLAFNFNFNWRWSFIKSLGCRHPSKEVDSKFKSFSYLPPNFCDLRKWFRWQVTQSKSKTH